MRGTCICPNCDCDIEFEIENYEGKTECEECGTIVKWQISQPISVSCYEVEE